MSADEQFSAERARDALLQTLESLQRAGVTELNKPAPVPSIVVPPSVDRPHQESGVPRDPPITESAMKTPTTSRPNKRVPPSDLLSGALPPPLPRAQRVETLRVLREEVAQCVQCEELAETRTQTVFGVGNPTPRLCFFGEAPGADEDRLGEPFVGRAGKLLDKIIEACTMKREDVFILNVLKCRPPGNRDPAADEVANCRRFFERQLEILQPEFICCLGRPAMCSLLNTTQSVGRMRGRFHEYRGAKVLVTYHPAYLLRNPPAKREVWEDMKMLMAEMGIEIPKR